MVSTTTNKGFFSDVPPWAKGVLLIAIIGGVSVGAYVVYRKLKQVELDKNSKKEVDETASAVATLTKSGQKQTLDALKLSTIANQIQQAVSGYGSDESAVYRAFANVNTDLDVVNLIKAFGVREISSGAGNPAPNLKGTLSMVLTDELSAAEIKALNDLLARKGIKYRF